MIGGVPDIVQHHVIRILTSPGSAPVHLLDFAFLAGGCINAGGLLKTSRGDYFIKWNDASRFPRMFETEASGLRLLHGASPLRIPAVIGTFEEEHYQGIVLELINSHRPSSYYWQELGRGLAALHNNSQAHFGLGYANYIGSLPQANVPTMSWSEFFAHQRLAPQFHMALDSGRLDAGTGKHLEILYSKLPGIFPEEKPALLHGDLWTGNVIVDDTGNPCLIDPAVYFGHREAELAFTQLFGGFDDVFYNAYEESFPLAPGFRQRIDVYNLYPLLVHVNLFGGGYANQVRSILKNLI